MDSNLLRQIDKPTKFCKTCQSEKSVSDFSIKYPVTGVLQARCKACQRAYSKQHYQNNPDQKDKKSFHKKQKRDFTTKLKESTPCSDCNNIFPACAMDFDHLYDKKFTISLLPGNIESLKTEIAKCEIVCANCHRVRTYNRKHGPPRR